MSRPPWWPVGSPAVIAARAREVRLARGDVEAQDWDVVVGELAELFGTIMHYFGVRDGDAAFGWLAVEQLARIAEYVYGQPCTCAPEAAVSGDACGRCQALNLVADRSE
jgi:hypothetical protein